ncbi:EscU/YscU/HrcU family type III secretion system export apparatus switch protein [Campylobacter sp. RM9344]|uniref:EscU/YscU/HrcU family type III secretion system export apparatus switch protein n=2 Tax=Campylobacter californiensis TaxID=1032243 RepID=A0AAW3ZUU1_9BACT|nr:EscU/YscU/HrcU family type III secretion system export apparatus switch protein [Campylobacter sp. RM6883]MBE2986529.1 EscU/YscU/HrcU family type III secretion system export apparatus switch protein [Campylobacter sp. RM12919]MBE2987729.1 EscU/YscU/HrcU family type III secretion system export apparatus switch protein [Campylobacter sp. RM12920]MBE2994709.1 EscU/YscU/HrcU family type III secretion system export apparatus switch protein [Campylobacter sp. RM6913]MBE3029575.1 EscU/YscU/HrcU fam
MKITKKRAVALGYNRKKDNAPKVLASGSDYMADKIISVAKKHEIPIKEDPDLIEILSKVEVNQEIPPNLYKAVAEIFGFLYKVTNNK